MVPKWQQWAIFFLILFLCTEFTQPQPSTEKNPIFTEVIKYHSVSNLPDYQKDQEQK